MVGWRAGGWLPGLGSGQEGGGYASQRVLWVLVMELLFRGDGDGDRYGSPPPPPPWPSNITAKDGTHAGKGRSDWGNLHETVSHRCIILPVISCCSLVRCCHWGKFLTTACESISILT